MSVSYVCYSEKPALYMCNSQLQLGVTSFDQLCDCGLNKSGRKLLYNARALV